VLTEDEEAAVVALRRHALSRLLGCPFSSYQRILGQPGGP
jgi:hypothetical protein